jgi:hypothetical protein
VVSRKGEDGVVFTDGYQDTFATLGVRLRSEDACSAADIEDAERRLAVSLPRSLKEYYLVAGREKRINQFHNRLLPPEKLWIDSERVVFMEENQWVVYWGVPALRETKSDAAVFQGVNRRDKGIEWHPEADSCPTFLNVMAVWHASFGGAAAHTAVGYVDQSTTRAMLDEQWKLIGEVNAMRAYKQSGRAVCFLKWEDLIQKHRKLPAWRVFAAAANSDELEQLKASVQAQWEEWGRSPRGGPQVAEHDGRCAECRSTNLEVVSMRDVQRPARRGEPQDAERPVVARKVEVRCRRCGWSDFILRRVN